MILGQRVACPCAVRAYVRMLKVDKAGLVCTSVQLQWPHRVDEVLIRALTAGVRRSLGDSGFWLGPREPRLNLRAWRQGGSGGPQHHDTADFSRSLHPACFFLLLFFFLKHVGTHTKCTHNWLCSTHTDNSQGFVITRQEEPIVRLNQLASLQLKNRYNGVISKLHV